ncbi:MAG: hypothetical protein AB7U59_14935 [Desulfovibrionaceae bacterium]
MRAKIEVQSVTKYPNSVTVKACPVVADGIPENESFNMYTPSGSLELGITNPFAFDFFVPGKQYYLDFAEAPKE